MAKGAQKAVEVGLAGRMGGAGRTGRAGMGKGRAVQGQANV